MAADVSSNIPNMMNRNAFSAPEVDRHQSPLITGGKYTPGDKLVEDDDSTGGTSSALADDRDDDFRTDDEDREVARLTDSLDEDTIGNGLSNLGRSADGQQQVYLDLVISRCGLRNISLLAEYTHLQKLDISNNKLEEISALGNLPYLLYLNASHNKISKLVDFTPPKNIFEVDLSYNWLTEMCDLSPHHCLKKLNLSSNFIERISGLQSCHRLSHLSLSHNKIQTIQGLDGLPIKDLNLSKNKLIKIENLETLEYLQYINLSGNTIRSMNGLQGHNILESIDLEENEVIDLSEIKHISDLPMLCQLNLMCNPIQDLPDYRLSVLFKLQRLVELDRRKVEACEKVAAVNLFNPPMEVVASRDHVMHVVYSMLQPARIHDCTLASIETPYPMLILVGPQGSGKQELALKLVEEFPEYFGYAISHTTRPQRKDEENGKDYNFISMEEFEAAMKAGKFVQTYKNIEHWYGLQLESIESVAREGLACIAHMELEGVLSLKMTYFAPRYVMILPLTLAEHEKRLDAYKFYSPEQVIKMVHRGEMYAEYNRDHPGYFDMMINSDNLEQAYLQIRHLIMDYLGIAPTPPTSCSDPASDPQVTPIDPAIRQKTWSKLSMADTGSSQPPSRSRGAKTQSPIVRGILEEESLKRRKGTAKETAAGQQPALYQQLVNQYPKTVPDMTTTAHRSELRSVSAPAEHLTLNMDALPLNSPDSSTSRSNTTDHLSDLSSLSQRSADDQKGSGQGSMSLPTEMVDPLQLLSGEPNYTMGSYVRSTSGDHACHSQGRPGSNRHPVVPPISPSH